MRILSYLRFPRVTRLAWKVWLRNKDVFMKTYKVNFIPPFLEPLLYLLALGFGLGFFIREVDGLPYAVFIAPSFIAISIMNTAFFNCTFGSYVRMYYQKTYDAIIATPLSIEDVIGGELLWGATRSLINASIMLPVVASLGLVQLPVALLVVPFAFLGGFIFSTIGMCFTAISPDIESLNYPTFLLVTPMMLFSGTFFPMSLLPETVQGFALATLPLVHVVSITRALTLNSLGWFQLYNLAWILAVSIIFFILSVNLMKKRLIV